MNDKLIKKEAYLKPGFICLSVEPMCIYTVVGSGIVITIFDTKLKCGGMNHYFKPNRESIKDSTPVYACPAIIGLLKMFFDEGSKLEDLEAHVYGGAGNPKIEGYMKGLDQRNIQTGLEILELKKIRIIGRDVGGNRARKIVFNTLTGEVFVAKVDKVRASDWYPQV